MLLTIRLELLIAIKVEERCIPYRGYINCIESLLVSPRLDYAYYVIYAYSRDSKEGNRASNRIGDELINTKDRGILSSIRLESRLGSLYPRGRSLLLLLLLKTYLDL